MEIRIDTCVLPRSRLETGRIYRERFGPDLGYELLPMFDLPGFEENLIRNLDFLASGPLSFHEPVPGVEHAAPKGSAGYEESMFHLRLTLKYARILQPSAMVFHLTNGTVPEDRRDQMLRTALDNLEEVRDLFSPVPILVENTGIRADRTLLLDQAEFTDLCRSRSLSVLIDVGHANANGWDIPLLIRDLKDQIRGFHLHNNDGIHDLHNRLRDGTADYSALLPLIDRLVPSAPRIIEYTRPVYHGEPLAEDIAFLRNLRERTETA